jgi:predicted N-formylglutamate amidohydrolase
LEVTELSLGTLILGRIQANLSIEDGAKPVARAMELGINLIDTAASYGSQPHVREGLKGFLGEVLITTKSHGVHVPGNQRVDAMERERRIREFYWPYHEAVDAVLAQRPDAFLLSVHSFTPVLNGRERRFDVGVLFDSFAAEAEQLGDSLAADGLTLRYNQPYSGLDGLIFSARTHGVRHGLRYLELEVNNRLLRDAAGIDAIATAVARAVGPLLEP